jgi:hypothetical protein
MFCIPHVCPNKYMIGLAEQIVLHPSPSPPTSPPPPHLCWKLVSSIVHPATPPPPPSPLHTYDGNYFQHCLPTHPPTLSPLPHLPPTPWTPSQHVCWKPGEGGGGGGGTVGCVLFVISNILTICSSCCMCRLKLFMRRPVYCVFTTSRKSYSVSIRF